jgi:nicotinate-nucleotide adenylyltransferase
MEKVSKEYKITADAVVLAGNGEDLSLLLIKRKYPPFKGEWALPGGFSEPQESPVDTCRRELKEETGLELTSAILWPLSTRELVGRDPRGKVISYPFIFHQENTTPLKEGDDAAVADWVPITKIERLAFDHGAILCEALGYLFPLLAKRAPRKVTISLPRMLTRNLDLDKNQQAVIFPGTFVPWHDGHNECIRQAPTEMPLIVIPDSNPWKSDDNKPSEHICYWCEYLKINAQIRREEAIVYPGFFGMEHGNPTIDWITSLRFNYKIFLMGDDALFSIEQWKEAETLLGIINKILVVPRNHSLAEINQFITQISMKYQRLTTGVLSEHPYQDVSSSQIRSSLQQN